MNVRFVVKFPKDAGTRDVILAFRERRIDTALGQMKERLGSKLEKDWGQSLNCE